MAISAALIIAAGRSGKAKIPAKQSTKTTGVLTLQGNTIKKAASATTVKGAAAAIASAAEAAKKKKAAEAAAKKKPTTPTGSGAASAPASTASAANANDLISWGGSRFFVTPTFVRSYKNLQISASCDTEDEESGGEKYARKKNDGAYKFNLTAILDKRLGEADVRTEALRLAESARTGTKDYVYNCGSKLFTPQMMGADATIKNIVCTPGGEWISCEVDITLKQCSKNDGTTGGSSSTGSGGGSGRYYKVQISGMSELKIWATSVQGAVTKGCGANYTGYVTVDGTTHYVNKGKIDDAYMKEDKKKDTVKGAKDSAKKTTDDAKKASDYLTKKFDSLKPAKTTTPKVTPAKPGNRVHMVR